MAGILFCMSGHLVAKENKDTLILDRIYEYQKANLSEFKSLEDNVYTKFRYTVERRNSTLWLIPSAMRVYLSQMSDSDGQSAELRRR